MTLPSDAYPAAAIRQLERQAIESGVAGFTLMQRAGAAALDCLRRRWPGAQRIVVIAGTGNNGGDGLVLARLARQAGIDCRVLVVGDIGVMRGEAAQALQALRAAGMAVQPFDVAALGGCDVLVDALLGIGVRAPLQPAWRAAIDGMNTAGLPILALDLPSGLDPDTGQALPAVKAAATLTFIGLKQGLLLGEGPDHAGALEFNSLDVAPLTARSPVPSLQLLDADCLAMALNPRPRHSHKGLFGRVLIVGGGAGMAGAARLAGEAALRVGAGLVTVASRPEHLGVVVGGRPELMFLAVERGADLNAGLEQADVVAIGPGLGRSSWALDVLDTVLSGARTGQRLVLDADALNLVAASGALHRDDWILTPHPGEAARLLGSTTAAVQADRPAALAQLLRARGGIVVLKGAGTLVGRQEEIPRLCTRGNPGMAVPGMGDVLTGAVAGLAAGPVAQGLDCFAAVCAAVQAHAMAGDRCAEGGVRGILAQDVATQLRGALAHLP